MRCSDLLGAADDATGLPRRCFITAPAAKARMRVIDVGKIDENVGEVMRQCGATPNIRVPQAFRETLRPNPTPG
jgi:glycosyltransferase 2 family protein